MIYPIQQSLQTIPVSLHHSIASYNEQLYASIQTYTQQHPDSQQSTYSCSSTKSPLKNYLTDSIHQSLYNQQNKNKIQDEIIQKHAIQIYCDPLKDIQGINVPMTMFSIKEKDKYLFQSLFISLVDPL